MSDEVNWENPKNVTPEEQVIVLQKKLVKFNKEIHKLKEERIWVRNKIRVSQDAPITEVQGTLHVMESHASGYVRYIETYKCEDKQGEIARQSVKIQELKDVIEALKKQDKQCETDMGILQGGCERRIKILKEIVVLAGYDDNKGVLKIIKEGGGV